jgi:hypothetical protein
VCSRLASRRAHNPLLIAIVIVAVAVAVEMLAPPAAMAGQASATATDPDDARGPLDIKQLYLGRPTASSPLDIVVTYFRRVPAKIFSKGGHTNLWFDTQGNAHAEWTGSVTRTRRGLVLVITGRSGEWGRVPVRRPNLHELAVTLPGASPANPIGDVAVRAKSAYKRPRGPCKHACTDRAPDAHGLVI